MKLLQKILPITLIFTFLISMTAFAYIGNRNTHKFHYDNCYSVSQMAERNKVYFDNRYDAINHGYVPCKRCNP